MGSVVLGVATTFTAQAQQSKRERKEEVRDAIAGAIPTSFVLGPKNPAHDNHAFVFYTGDDGVGYDTGLDALVEQRELLMGTHWVRFGTSYLFMGGGGVVAGAGLGDNYGYVPAGPCVLRVPRNGSIAEVTEGSSGRSTKFETDTLRINFERGKYYAIDRRLDADNRITFTIEETDPEEFAAFQRANPGLLEGTWSGEDKTLLNRFTMRYTISGDRITFEGTNNKNLITAEGRLAYTENAIIMFPERAIGKGKEVKKFAEQLPYIWKYTLDGDVLRLEGVEFIGMFSRPFGAGATLWESRGELHRVER